MKLQSRLRTTRRRSVRHALMALLLFQGLSAVAGGYGLVADPSGVTLGIPVSWLQGSPFSNFRVPGLILLLALGVFPLLVACGLWARLPGSRSAALLVGVALIVWIGVQILIVGYHARPPLQLIYGVLGVAILTLAALPR